MSRISSFINAISEPRDYRGILRTQVKSLAVFDTYDSKILNRKLEQPDVRSLMHRARLFSGFPGADLSEVAEDLRINLVDAGMEKSDYAKWIRDNPVFLSAFDYKRLDWLWSCSWTYRLWGADHFGKNGLHIYSLIRGPRPESLDIVFGFQTMLNVFRKITMNGMGKHLLSLARSQDIEGLMKYGLSNEQANLIIQKYSN